VTFVALGNGAPDLSANITAIQSGQVLLSAGGITGAAMFVQCIVAAEVGPPGGGDGCVGMEGSAGWRRPRTPLPACQAAGAPHRRPALLPPCPSRPALKPPRPRQLIAMSPNGVKCAGAMTRDVAVYAVSIASVLLAFALGRVRRRAGSASAWFGRRSAAAVAGPHSLPLLHTRCPAPTPVPR
jgi:hypothetical protein